MPTIRPISDMRNNFHSISELCHEDGEPIFLTKNGKGDLVVMSIEEYERREALLDLYKKLTVAELESASGAETMDHRDVISKLRDRIHG